MEDRREHSRRDFLQGKAAAQTLVSRAQNWAQNWLDKAGVVLERLPADPVVHLRAARRAMACEFAVQYHQADRQAEGQILDAFEIIEEVENRLTIYREHSKVIDLNRRAAEEPVHVDAEFFGLLQHCLNLFHATGGAFDITSTPLSRVWGFLKREGRLPSEEEISEALSKVDSHQIELNEREQTLRFCQPGMEINFNSIGKGYALDRVADFLDEAGISDYLWNGGGSSILARGRNRAGEEDCWTIGLRHPLEPVHRLAEFHLRDRALGTAGGATQFFEIEGKKYGHILDPRIGWPAQGIYTSTVLAPTAAEADALATAFYVAGVEATADFCLNRPEVAAVLVCPQGKESEISVQVFNLQPGDWAPTDKCKSGIAT